MRFDIKESSPLLMELKLYIFILQWEKDFVNFELRKSKRRAETRHDPTG